MTTLKLYYDLLSQPCRAVALFLKLNKIPYEGKQIALRKGEHFSPEFTKINPFQKVPVLEHNEFILTESVAMVRYLSREFNISDHWYPKDSKLQARVDEYLEWQHLNTRLFGSMIFRTRVITPILESAPVDEKQLKFYMNNFEKVLDDIQKGFLRDNLYLCGNQISVADIFGAAEIEQPLLIGFDPISSRPKIKDWLERVRNELQPYYSEIYAVPQKMKSAIAQGKL